VLLGEFEYLLVDVLMYSASTTSQALSVRSACSPYWDVLDRRRGGILASTFLGNGEIKVSYHTYPQSILSDVHTVYETFKTDLISIIPLISGQPSLHTRSLELLKYIVKNENVMFGKPARVKSVLR
jgi:hypothetical protein